MRILVLGAGRMGLGAAFDLAHNSEGVESVTVADIDEGRARAVAETVGGARIRPQQIDVADAAQVVELMRGHDSVISCVTYFHNLRLARAAIEAGANFCDLGGNNAVVDAELALDSEARAAGVRLTPDCGLAPGMVSVLVAHGAERFHSLEDVHIRVGGLPQNPKPPLDYQMVFSVEGLINEYVERARVIREGHVIEVESMTEIEALDFPEPFGRMEAFQTSGGTSTLPETFAGRLRTLDYKTIRYPGHCERFKLLIDLGLAGSDEIELDGARLSPRRMLGELLTRNLPADEPDLVFVRVEFKGRMHAEDAATTTLRYDIIDRQDERTGLSAMMRTTAFPASIIAQMMARGETSGVGAIPQERSVPPQRFVEELAARDIKIEETTPRQELKTVGREVDAVRRCLPRSASLAPVRRKTHPNRRRERKLMFALKSYPCPNCREFINTSMTAYQFCSAPVDPQAAMAAVEAQDKINDACNSASLIRNLAGGMWVCFFARLVPFIGLVATAAMLLLFILVPIRLVYWLAKYGGIQTADVDFKRARRNLLIAFGLWLLIIIVPLVLIFIFAGALALTGK